MCDASCGSMLIHKKKLLLMENFEHLDEEELKAENDFLKMKIMLERGGYFGNTGENELPAQVENAFLKNVIEFEKQFGDRKTIKVFDKIERPGHFKPVSEIADDEINEAWDELSNYLDEYNIKLGVCSPNISARELYRFTLEELFDCEIEDITMEGMMHGFIYDEFHPDPVYDNSRAAEDECITYILQKKPLEWTHHFCKQNLRFNEYFPLTIEEFIKLTDNFKNAYDDIVINEIKTLEAVVNEKESIVTGLYEIMAICNREVHLLTGNWKVIFEKGDELEYWYINEVKIDGIQF